MALMTRKRKLVIVLAAVLLLFIAGRIALPYIVEDYANDRLAALDSYDGHVGDIDLHLWRGAYSIDDIVIVKTGAKRPVPFFSSRRVDLSVEWRSLLRGSVVAEAEFDSPEVNLVQGKSKADTQLGEGEDWNARLEELFPFRFNTIGMNNGTVRFLAPGISTRDAITARRVQGQVTNLTNVIETGKETFASFHVNADVLDGAPAVVNGSVDAFAKQPTFDVNMEVKKVQLPQVNPWLREYIKADAEAGKFELYMELAAADGKFTGYAKPILQDVDLYRSNEEEQSPAAAPVGRIPRFRCRSAREPGGRPGGRAHPLQWHHQASRDQPVRDHRKRDAQRLHQRFRALTRRFDHAARREEKPQRARSG